MEAERFIATVLGKNGGVGRNRIQFPSSSSFALDLDQVTRGILFIFAEWSGPSIQAFRELTSVLAGRSDLDVPIFVLNTDEVPKAFFEDTLKLIPAGAGETFWIKDGHVIHAVPYFSRTSPPEIIKFTESLKLAT